MRRKLLSPLVLAVCVGVVVGLAGSALWSSPRGTWRSPLFGEVRELTKLPTVRVLPHAELAVSGLEARASLEAGQPWRAWRLLRDEVDGEDVAAGYVLLAARAAADWGGWGNVRRLLADRDWLAKANGGEGLFLLGRAEEELRHPDAAAAAYRRYLAVASGESAAEARVRLGSVLARTGDHAGAAAAYASAAPRLPLIEDWLRALQAQQLAAAGRSTAGTELRGPASVAARKRHARAVAASLLSAGDTAQAALRLSWDARVIRAQGGAAEAAALEVERARLLLRLGRRSEARDALRTAAWESSAPASLRLAAARTMGDLDGLTAQDELARSAAYEAARQPGLAARSLRSAIVAGGYQADAGLQLKLARLLYEERDYGPARVAFRKVSEQLRDPALVAEAKLYAARSLYLGGGKARWDAIAEFKQVASDYPSTPAAATALFLLGDAASSVETGLSYYRRAAAIGGSPEAREALYRVGDRSLKLGNRSAGLRAWEEYVRRYPSGASTAEIAYHAARLYEKVGDDDAARAMYRAAIHAEPASYAAMRAADHSEIDLLDGVVGEPRPWPGLAADEPDAAAVLRRLAELERVGLDDAWEEELDAATRAFASRPAGLLTLGEGLRDQGHTVEGIRIGRQLLASRGVWDLHLLRLVFPLSYRSIVQGEAEKAGIDPMLLAGLVRQESSFRADAHSHAGAIGLGQIMPSTGRWLAHTADVRSFDDDLLEVPEINLRMASVYLRDLLRRYHGVDDLALAAYNAGPSRADRWRRQWGSGGDRDAFREAIPFDETREYVKLVLRNASMYSRLYGNGRAHEVR
jgi:soluble lytic murein transglycosylase